MTIRIKKHTTKIRIKRETMKKLIKLLIALMMYTVFLLLDHFFTNVLWSMVLKLLLGGGMICIFLDLIITPPGTDKEDKEI